MIKTQRALTEFTGLSTVKSGLTGEAPTLMFDHLKSWVSGFAGCNFYFGAYRLAEDGDIFFAQTLARQ